MFERFTPDARMVIALAQDEATRALQHRAIGTQHLLLGVLRLDSGAVDGVTLHTARLVVMRDIGHGVGRRRGVSLTRCAQQVLRAAFDLAMYEAAAFVTPEHLLRALLDEPGALRVVREVRGERAVAEVVVSG